MDLDVFFFISAIEFLDFVGAAALFDVGSYPLSALLGWIYYRESLTLLDWIGAMMIVAALILVRLRVAPRQASEAA